MLYKTRCVYNGTVRNTVKDVSICGKIEYTRCRHPLYYLYEQYEVLQPKNLKDIVPEIKFIPMDDVGCEIAYNKSFLNNKNYTENTKKDSHSHSGSPFLLDGKDCILDDDTVNVLGD